MPSLESLQQRFFIHPLAPGSVDQVGAGLYPAQEFSIDHTALLVPQRPVQG
jgi:hypothetical protein